MNIDKCIESHKQHHNHDIVHFHQPTKCLCPSVVSFSPPPRSLATVDPITIVLPILELHINEVTQYAVSCVCKRRSSEDLGSWRSLPAPLHLERELPAFRILEAAQGCKPRGSGVLLSPLRQCTRLNQAKASLHKSWRLWQTGAKMPQTSLVRFRGD